MASLAALGTVNSLFIHACELKSMCGDLSVHKRLAEQL